VSDDGSRSYAAAHDGAALASLDRGVLAAAGPDRQKFLQAMLSNEILALSPAQGCSAALLDVKGHAQALLRVLVLKDAVHMEMARDRIAAVEATLNHYKVGAPVRFAVKPLAVLALLGPAADAVLAAAGAESPGEGHESHRETTVAGQAVRLVRARDLPVPGLVLHVADAEAAAVREALLATGASPLEAAALDALRVEAGRPWYGRDVTDENLLHETGLVAECCSFSKGCYLGQEVIARLDARGGHVNKRMRGLRLTAATSDGARVTADGKEIGRVTTAALSPRLGPIALAYVHRSHAETGTVVGVGNEPATVQDLPFALELPRTA
jgi:folate-binding protein YgfZ